MSNQTGDARQRGGTDPAHRGPPIRRGQTVSQLQEAVRRLTEERDRLLRRRRRNLLIVGVSLSLLAHVVLMVYLSYIHRAVPSGGFAQPVSLQFAVIHDQELTQIPDIDSQELEPEIPWDHEDLSANDPAANLDPEMPAASLEISDAGSVPALGGAGTGAGGETTLGGGGAGTSFFGVSSRGSRFAYIVDVSGSMSHKRKFEVCMAELAQSIQTLPDYASFFVVLYSSGARPFDSNWTRARPTAVSNLIRWLNGVDPGGGTQPGNAFLEVFSLRHRADVIFFLTDGLIPQDTPEAVATLNRRGKRVVINTIAFGDGQSQKMLREIATKSGGVYRHVSSDGW